MKAWMALVIATILALGVAVAGGIWLSVSKQGIKAVLQARADEEIASRDLPMSRPHVPRTVHQEIFFRRKQRKANSIGRFFAPPGSLFRWHPDDGGLAYIEVSGTGKLLTAVPLQYAGQCWSSADFLKGTLSEVDFSNPPVDGPDDVFRGVIHAGCPEWLCMCSEPWVDKHQIDLWPLTKHRDAWPLNVESSLWEYDSEREAPIKAR